MSDSGNDLLDRLRTLREALERVPRRFAGIASPADFTASDDGIDRMDAICMTLIAAGEEIKSIDRVTQGQLLSRYPQVRWRGAMGMRDVLAHAYFQVNVDQLFAVCHTDVPELIAAITQMIWEIEHGAA
jgi:uncharacterized protein with HEPN domain